MKTETTYKPTTHSNRWVARPKVKMLSLRAADSLVVSVDRDTVWSVFDPMSNLRVWFVRELRYVHDELNHCLGVYLDSHLSAISNADDY